MECHHVPQNQSAEVITTYINTVDSDLQITQKQKHTHKQHGECYRGLGIVACQLTLLNYLLIMIILVVCQSTHDVSEKTHRVSHV